MGPPLLAPPETTSTIALGVSGNNVVGYYDDGSGWYRGFLYDGLNYTTVDYPGAIDTFPVAVSGNNVVGHYGDSIGTRAFLYNAAEPYVIPEPSTLIIWSVLGALGLTVRLWRRRRTA